MNRVMDAVITGYAGWSRIMTPTKDPMRRHLNPMLAAAMVSSLALGCAEARPVGPTDELERDPRLHLDLVLDIMQASSVKRLLIDWPVFRADVISVAAGATTVPELYPAIGRALELLGDGHSFYIGTHGNVFQAPTRNCNLLSYPFETIPDDIGYVRVRSFSGTPAQAAVFADALQETIREQDRADLTGWVVDLRGNTGGNMWPMLAGIGPLLGEGTAGSFVQPTGPVAYWGYADGRAYNGTSTIQQVDEPYTVINAQPRVAVITDRSVISSGEAIAVAFRKRPNTRSFGTPTCGLSTANSSIPVEDATLVLTVALMGDRDALAFGDQLAPDELVSDAADVMELAIAWLQSN